MCLLCYYDTEKSSHFIHQFRDLPNLVRTPNNILYMSLSSQPSLLPHTPSPLQLHKPASSSRILWRQVHHLGAQYRIPLEFAPHLPPLLALLGLLALLCLVGQLIVPQRLMRKGWRWRQVE